jgi:transposase
VLLRGGRHKILFAFKGVIKEGQEATSIYSFDLAQYLSQQKIKVMVVNPIITHAFFKMELNLLFEVKLLTRDFGKI